MKTIKTPTTNVTDIRVGDHRLVITVDRYNWNVMYGKAGSKNPTRQNYSNIVNMAAGLQEAMFKRTVKEISLEHIRSVVAKSQETILDITNDIKTLFIETPFPTPERRHEENRIRNIKGNKDV